MIVAPYGCPYARLLCACAVPLPVTPQGDAAAQCAPLRGAAAGRTARASDACSSSVGAPVRTMHGRALSGRQRSRFMSFWQVVMPSTLNCKLHCGHNTATYTGVHVGRMGAGYLHRNGALAPGCWVCNLSEFFWLKEGDVTVEEGRCV